MDSRNDKLTLLKDLENEYIDIIAYAKKNLKIVDYLRENIAEDTMNVKSQLVEAETIDDLNADIRTKFNEAVDTLNELNDVIQYDIHTL